MERCFDALVYVVSGSRRYIMLKRLEEDKFLKLHWGFFLEQYWRPDDDGGHGG